MTRTVRRLGLAELGILLDWAAGEGWNPGRNDARAFHAADPQGFFGAFVGDTMVAGISTVAYDDRFGFVGLYICHPGWRGQGHGKAVWDAGMAYLGDRTVGLDGVPEQQANYARMGFVPAYETIRMSGTLAADPSAALAEAGIDAISALDRTGFPASRKTFLRRWLASPNRGLVHRSAGMVDGYAVLRPCHDGAKIGPLFADDVAVAMDLLSGIGGAVHIDVPATQAAWLDHLVALGLRPGFRTMRMYRGAPPELDLDRVFGITSLELG